jgi:hypothetical protein
LGDRTSRPARRGFILGTAALVAAGTVRSTASRAQQQAPDDPSKAQLRKRTREEVKYQNEPYLGRSCAKCVLYQGNGVCVILEGTVSPNGWCTQWVPNTMG